MVRCVWANQDPNPTDLTECLGFCPTMFVAVRRSVNKS